ncbi:MAG: 3,4-dihydroxy-2-butanone-4-phosphate synthase [Isosphaeraceae bacterium]
MPRKRGDFVAAADRDPRDGRVHDHEGRGQLCVPILPDLAERLRLHPMVDHNTALYQTGYTIPVDAQEAGTGISASARALTIRTILDPRTLPEDLKRPGHLFPLVAKEGRPAQAGHTEAAVDLARLAGRKPAGVICEILDGTGVAGRGGSPRSPASSACRSCRSRP